MSAIGANFSTSISDLTEGKGFGLGDRYVKSDGTEYVFCQANGAISKNDVVVFDEAYQADQADTTSTAAKVGLLCGVAPYAFADNDYGWIQVKGPCTVNVGTSCGTYKTLNSTATSGRIDDDATTGAETILGLVTTGAESSNLAAGMLNYPAISATL